MYKDFLSRCILVSLPLPTLFTLCLFGLLLLATDSVLSDQKNDKKNWYQVEVLVFKNLEASAVFEEQWPHSPNTYYPSGSRHLENGSQQVDADNTHLWQEQNSEQEDASIGRQTSAALTHIKLTDPSAFRLLPVEYHEFSEYASRMRWSKNYQVLFHQSWRQAITDRDSSEPIIIESDKGPGLYPQLQGTIQLSVSRYLHVQTRLWLNMAELPSVEKEPRSTPPLYNKDWQFHSAVDTTAIEPQTEIVNETGGAIELDENSPGTVVDGLPKWHRKQLETLPTSTYPYAGAVIMTQKRRMRSGEEHYIDHPLFGMIIKITPYKFTAFVEADSPATADNSPESSPVIP